jgi:hypothetical protein
MDDYDFFQALAGQQVAFAIINLEIPLNSDGKIHVWKALSNSGKCKTKDVYCWH